MKKIFFFLLVFLLNFLFHSNILHAQVSAGEVGNTPATQCTPVNMNLQSVSGCVNINCCEGECIETGTSGENKTFRCELPSELQCTTKTPCPVSKTCVYYNVNNTYRTKCMTDAEYIAIGNGSAACETDADCEQQGKTGEKCLSYDKTTLSSTSRSGCFPQSSIDTIFSLASTQASPSKYTVPEFELQKPILSIPIPGFAGFSDTQIQGEDGARFVDIPWIYEYVSAVYKFGIVFAIAVAILMFMVAGILRMLPGQEKLSNSLISSSLAGLVILLSSYLLMYTINPNTLDFDNLRIDVIEAEPLVTLPPSDPENSTQQGLVYSGKSGIVPYLNQADPNWNTEPIAPSSKCPDRTIQKSGCLPTSTTMILRSLGFTQENPLNVARFLFKDDNTGGMICSGGGMLGSRYAMVEQINKGNPWGIKGKTLSKEESLNLLKQGNPIIFNCPCDVTKEDGSIKTWGGHFIVLTGIDSNGNISVADPGNYKVKYMTPTQFEKAFTKTGKAIQLYK